MPESRTAVLGKRLLGARVMDAIASGRPRRNLVITLLTTGEDGYPNVCLLSPYQVVSVDGRSILLAVYEGSKTSANLERHKSATLLLFLPPAAHYVKGDVELVGSSELGNFFRLKVTGVTRDYYSRAPIRSTVTFEEKNVLPDYVRVFRGLVEMANRKA